MHARDYVRALRGVGARVEQTQRTMEQDFAAAHRLQLRQRLVVRAGLADLQAVVGGDLVGADHERSVVVGEAGGDRAGFRLRKPQRGDFRRFAGERRFVDGGNDNIERNRAGVRAVRGDRANSMPELGGAGVCGCLAWLIDGWKGGS